MNIKRIAALASALSLCLSANSYQAAVSADEVAEIYLHGDLNFNNSLEITDYVLLKNSVLSGAEDNELTKLSADMNEDSYIDSQDILIMQEYMHGITADTPVKYFCITPETDIPDEPVIPDKPVSSLIPSSVSDANASTQSLGEARTLMLFIEFSDAKFSSDRLSEEQLQQEFFGEGVTAYPFESLSAYIDRSSYGNMSVSGDVFYCSLNGKLEDYSSAQGREKLIMDVMKQLDDSLDYSDYDADHDGDIDILTFTVPLDNASDEQKNFWYGATHTWYYNSFYKVDNVRIGKYIGNDVMPYKKDMYYLKQTLLHELGHSMGLPDIYKYASSDSEGLKGNAGFCRMDDSIGDYSVFSKLMLGWLSEDKVQIYDRKAGGEQEFDLVSSAIDGSCILLPLKNWDGTFTNEYFLVEYITADKNNYDVKNWFGGWWNQKNHTGIRIFHVNASMYVDYWGRKDFMYDNYSDMYRGDDKERVLRLVNDEKKGFFKSGDTVTELLAYDWSGYESVQSGYTVKILGEKDGVYRISVSCE